MGIGEKDTEITAVILPIAGMKLSMKIFEIYKLICIKDSLAYFDETINATMNADTTIMYIDGGGSGTGKLIYNLKNEFTQEDSYSFIIKIAGNTYGLKINSIIESSSFYKYVVTNN